MEKTFEEFMDLSQRQGKVMIIGEEGSGKTLLSTAIGVFKMLRGQEDCWKSFEQVDKYNSLGYHFSKEYEHLVFSNFDINCSGTRIPSRKSYILDPYKVGLSCDDYYTDMFPPYSFMIITEAQTVFNAYKWQYIRPEVRRYWETSRQADIEIIIDTNQPNLVYNGMRSLCNRVIYLHEKVQEIKDKDGIVIGHKLFVKEFKKYETFEKHIQTNKSELIKEEYTLILKKCFYKNYDTKQCRYLHLKGREEQDYILQHFPEIRTIEDVNLFIENFGVTVPDGYYVKSNNFVKKETEEQGEEIVF